jgi:acetyl-CoA synthetase
MSTSADTSLNELDRPSESDAPARPPDGFNMAYEVVDRHLENGLGNAVAMRFLSRSDFPEAAGELYSYRRLARESNRFANVLAGLSVDPGQRVFVLCPRVPPLYVGVLGALKGGHVVCPLFAAFGPEPIRQRMTIGDAAVLLTSKALYERKIAPIREQLSVRHVILIDIDNPAQLPAGTQSFHELMKLAPSSFKVADTTADSPALLHFTSGTTGTPKGAVHVHGALSMQRRSTGSVLGLRSDDVYWCTADPGWVTGTSYGILGPLAVGATSIIDEAEFDADRWYRLLDAQRVTVWYTAPTAIRMLMRAGAECARGHDLSPLRSAFSVGEPLNADAVRWGIEELGITFRDTWWQTETGSIMIANSHDADVCPGSMGKVVEGVTATLLATDDEGELVRDTEGHVKEISEPDVIGMIALRMGWSSMFRSYLNAPDRYARAFADGWYLSGDLARRDADGCFWFVGRADDVIKTAGHLIGPFEIESVLNEHPDVVGSGVYGVPDAVSGNAIHACVVVRDGLEADARLLSDVMAHARRRLGAALAPRQIVPIERLPLTRSGKVMRRLLRARELGLPEGDLSTLEGAAET